MAAALVQICVDPRLNHELVRLQVRQKLERSGIRAERIYILNEVGGNFGGNFGATARVLAQMGEPIVFCAVLHHDDCLTAEAGGRTELEDVAREMATQLAKLGTRCPVATGRIRTEHNHLLWSDEPEYRYVPFSFGAG